MRKAYEIARVTDNCAQGGPDAFVGMIGLGALGCIQPGQLCLITGSVATITPTINPNQPFIVTHQ